MLSVTVLSGGACGGSVSESPWPAEPIDPDSGPVGDARSGTGEIDTRKLPDNYSKNKKKSSKASPDAKAQDAASEDGDAETDIEPKDDSVVEEGVEPDGE